MSESTSPNRAVKVVAGPVRVDGSLARVVDEGNSVFAEIWNGSSWARHGDAYLGEVMLMDQFLRSLEEYDVLAEEHDELWKWVKGEVGLPRWLEYCASHGQELAASKGLESATLKKLDQWRHCNNRLCRVRSKLSRMGEEIALRMAELELDTASIERIKRLDWQERSHVQAARVAIEALKTRLRLDKEKKKRPRQKGTSKRRLTVQDRPLTDRQRQALELSSKHNGSITKIAEDMNVSRPTAKQHLEYAWRKVPEYAPKKRSGPTKVQRLPQDRRGQLTVTGGQ